MKRIVFVTVLAVSLLGMALAHGYIADPPARQWVCKNVGGSIWNGSINNAACAAAYQRGPATSAMWTQNHEYAVNVTDYSNPVAIQAAVPDGLLCSGQARYKGMSIAHADWPKKSVPAGGGNYLLKYSATAPHNPSYFDVYISKPGFNSATQELGWDNLIKLGRFEDPTLNRNTSPNQYEMAISLPADRQAGSTAVLFVHWQRRDAAGEGFYNCSDIVFSSDASPNPPTPNPPTPPNPTPPTPPTPNPPTPPAPNPPTPNPPTPPTPNPPDPTPLPGANNLDIQFTTQASWDVGFNGLILITNHGEAISDWSLSFKLAGNARVSDTVWGAAGSIQHNPDGSVTLKPNFWGGANIAPGQTIEIYYGGTGQHQGADICIINGANCR